jgi:hypothetical protein
VAETRLARVTALGSSKYGKLISVVEKQKGWWEEVGDTGYSCSVDYLEFVDKEAAVDKQIGGDHYKSLPLQPIEFIMKNKLDYCTGNAIKYLCRHKQKNGKQDLEKAIHYIQMLIEDEYPDAQQ